MKALLLVCAICVSPVIGQTWNSNSGGWSTGYGTVYGSFGYAMATQNIYNTTQMQIQRLQQRQMMIKQFGQAAVEKAEREAKAGRTSGSSSQSSGTSAPQIKVTPPPPVRNHGIFRPDPSVDTGCVMAEALGSSAEEKALIKQIFTGPKAAYETQTDSKGWKNNIAGALTFFTVTALTVYRDGAEPSDEAVDAYFKAVNYALDDIPEFANVPNKDKQAFNNVMIGFSGLLLAGYTEGKRNNDAATLKLYSQLAGELIKMVLKVEPERLRLKDGVISIG